MQKTYTLKEALPLIAYARRINEEDITMICYEDGSKHKFNYSHDGETRYINLNAAQGGINALLSKRSEKK